MLLPGDMDGLRRYALEKHVGVVMRRATPYSYFSVCLPAGAIRTLKSTLAVCEFGSGGLDDEHEFGVSGDAPDVRDAATVPGAAEMSDRGRQLLFFSVLGSNLAQAKRKKSPGNRNCLEFTASLAISCSSSTKKRANVFAALVAWSRHIVTL